MKKLILLCLGIFVAITVNVATAETTKQQQAKQTGLNTASQNQMYTQRLGTEVMYKSGKLAVISKTFSSVAPTPSGVYTIGHIPKCSIMTGSGYVSVSKTLAQSVPSTSIAASVSGITLIATTQISSAPVANAAASATASLATLTSCDRDIPIVMTVSGTVRAGRIDFTIPYIPYNQEQ